MAYAHLLRDKNILGQSITEKHHYICFLPWTLAAIEGIVTGLNKRFYIDFIFLLVVLLCHTKY